MREKLLCKPQTVQREMLTDKPPIKVEKEDVCPNLNIFKEKNLKTSGHI